MSFILDALRKSEAARRRSEAPDLFAAVPGVPAPARSRPAWPLWALGAIGVLSLIAALWLSMQRAPAPAAPERSPIAGVPPVAPMPPAPQTLPAASLPAASQTSAPPAPPPQTAVIEAPNATSPAASIAPPPQPAAAPSPRDPAMPPLSPPSEPLPPPPAVAAPPAGDAVVALADLDPAVRKQLPPLKLSMHLWNDAPAQRFVILDGQRLKEGDVLGDVVVERITRDGAVLAWRGARLKIELR